MPDHNERLPLVSQDLLHDLEDEFGDPAPVHTFAENYVTIWNERYARLVNAMRKGDSASIMDALHSVKIASTMIGASRLARLAAELESHLKRGDLKAVAEALPAVKSCGDATVAELTKKYINTSR